MGNKKKDVLLAEINLRFTPESHFSNKKMLLAEANVPFAPKSHILK